MKILYILLLCSLCLVSIGQAAASEQVSVEHEGISRASTVLSIVLAPIEVVENIEEVDPLISANETGIVQIRLQWMLLYQEHRTYEGSRTLYHSTPLHIKLRNLLI